MDIRSWVRRYRFNPTLIRLVKLLRINKFMNKLYYKVTLPSDKKIKISLLGYSAQFYVNTPEDLGFIEVELVDEREGEVEVLNRIFDMLKPGDVAYDIGANIGTHAVFMVQKVGKKGQVVAFEPEENNYRCLQQNVKLNAFSNIIPLQFAMGDVVGEGVLSVAGAKSTLTRKPYNIGFSQKVKIVPGDLLVRNENLPLPKVVKVDVEGYEYYVIRGLKKTLQEKVCQMICCEVHPTMLPTDIKPEMVIKLLKSFGFNRIDTRARGKTFHAFC